MSIQSIQVRRGLFANLPTLKDGELAYTEDTKQLWVGTASNGNQLINVPQAVSGVAPTITSVSPNSGNISSLFQTIVVTFSEAMNTESDSRQAGYASSIANPHNWLFSASSSSGSSSGTVSITSISTTATTATISTTGSGVPSGSTLTLTATAAIQAANGVALSAPVVSSYSYVFVSPVDAPTILSFTPAAGAISSIPSTIQVAFSKAVSSASTSDAHSATNPANWAISATSGTIKIAENTPITMSGNVATLPITSSGVIGGSTPNITLAALTSIQDQSGNALSGGLSVGYTFSAASGGGASSAAFVASQEGGRKPAPTNYTLNTDVTLATNSCKNETVGAVLKLTASANTALGATGLPPGFSLAWYKMQPITTTTASIVGGVTGTYYDPLIPIGNTLTVAVPGTSETDWLWCDIIVASTVPAATYNFTLTAGANSIAVTHTVWNYTIPAVPTIPLYIASNGYEISMQTYGSSRPNQADLSIQYSAMLKAHRISPINNNESWPPLINSGDPTQGLNLTTYQSAASSFTAECINNTLGAQWMPLHSQYLGGYNGTSSNLYSAGAGPNAMTVTGTNYAIATHNELNKAANAAFKNNNFAYFLDEPNFSNSGMLTGLQTELNAIKTAGAVQVKIMITTTINSSFLAQTVNGSPMDLVDIWCPIQGRIGYKSGPALSAYAGKTFWTYGALESHTWNWGSGDGSPDLMVDQDSHHCLAYPLVSYVYGATGTLYYFANNYPFWDGVLGSSSDIWAPGGLFSFSGNGDGRLMWVGRSGSYGLTSDQPIASIRLKNLREGLNLVDMMHAAGKDGKDLMTDALIWRTRYADFMSYRAMLGNMLNGGSYVAPAAAAPGEFYVTNIQAAAGNTIVKCLPAVNSIAPATSIELWAGTSPGGPYTRKCGPTYTGTISTGNFSTSTSAIIALNDPAVPGQEPTAGKTYYYKAKAINASAYTWSRTEKSAVFSGANTTGPGAVAGLALWYAADQGVTKDTSSPPKVSALLDQSPTGYNLSQASGTHQPTWIASAYNGSACLRFAGTGTAGTSVSTYQSLDSSATTLAAAIQDSSVFIVHNPADATTVMSPFCNMARGGAGAYLDAFANQGGKAISLLARNATTAAATGLQIAGYTTTASGNALKFYVNGVLDSTVTNGGYSPFIYWFRLGAGSNNGGGAVNAAPDKNWYSGDICEVIIYNTVISSTDRANVVAYLKNKWGIA